MKQTNRSGGPSSPEGKEKCSRNALKFGVYSTQHLLSDESPDEYQEHATQIRASFLPKSAFEKTLVEELSVLLWKKRRLLNFENGPIEAIKKSNFDPIRIRDYINIPEYCVWIVNDIDMVDDAFISKYESIRKYFASKKLSEFSIDEVAKLEHRCPVLHEEICRLGNEYFEQHKHIKTLFDITQAMGKQREESDTDEMSFLEFAYKVIDSNLIASKWVIERLDEIKQAIRVNNEERIMRYLLKNDVSRPFDDLNRAVSKVMDQLRTYNKYFMVKENIEIPKQTNSHLEGDVR
jgi:hypothetical protein